MMIIRESYDYDGDVIMKSPIYPQSSPFIHHYRYLIHPQHHYLICPSVVVPDIIYQYIYLSTYLNIHPSTYLSTYLPTYLPIYLSTYPLTYLPTYLPIYLHIYLPTYLLMVFSFRRTVFRRISCPGIMKVRAM